jgi:outer membrane immunogenic protein
MHVQRVLPLAASLLLLSSAAALADMPAEIDWGGFYAGVTGGGEFSDTHFALPGDTGDVLLQTRANKSTLVGGGLAGYNYQMGATVLGIEGDLTTGSGTSSVTACTVPDGCFTPTHDSFTTLNHLKTDLTGQLRARLGWSSGDMLFYAAAGYSFTDTKLSLVGLCYNAGNPTVPLVFNFARSESLSGFNLGFGVERGLSEHFVARAEFVYDDFGSEIYPGQSPEWNDRRISIGKSTVRVALSYRL